MVSNVYSIDWNGKNVNLFKIQHPKFINLNLNTT